MSPRLPLLLLMAGALWWTACEPEPVEDAEADAPAEASDEGGFDFVLGSAADLIVVSEDHDDSLALLLGGGQASAGTSGATAARGGSSRTGGDSSGGSGSTSTSTGGGGPAAPSLSDPGLGRSGGRTISPDQIQATIQQNSGQVRACYERELKSSPSLQGKVVVAWTIGADGRVRSPRAARNSTGNRELSGCVKRALRTWVFPKSESPQDIEYPFVFKPREF
jgi:TonB family protein